MKRLCVDLAKVVNNRRAVNSDKAHLVIVMIIIIITILIIITIMIIIIKIIIN